MTSLISIAVMTLVIFCAETFAANELKCPMEEVEPGAVRKVRIPTPMRPTEVPVDQFLADSVNSLASPKHIVHVERLLGELDGLALQPRPVEVPLAGSKAALDAWKRDVDEYFAGAEFNPQRRAELDRLFLDYVNDPPGGYLPGFEPTQRQHHPNIRSFVTSPDGRRELQVAEATLRNSQGFADVIDDTQDQSRRLSYAMKVRTSYFLYKLLRNAQRGEN